MTMQEDSHTDRLFSTKCFPLSIAINATSGVDDEEDEVSVTAWLGDHTPSQTEQIIDTDYIAKLVRDRSPEDIYHATVRVANLDVVPLEGGYRFRFQTKTWWQLEEFLTVLAGK